MLPLPFAISKKDVRLMVPPPPPPLLHRITYKLLNERAKRHTFRLLDRYLIRNRISKANFWFVDIPATSSSSLKEELLHKFNWAYGKNNIEHRTGFLRRYVLPSIHGHRTARDMRMFLGHQLWQRIFTFSIVRNPWSRYVSLFFFEVKRGNIPIHRGSRLLFKNWLTQQILCKTPTFPPAEKYLLDEHGNMIVDFVAKYENREEDLAYIGQKINYPEFGKILYENKRTPERFHYSEYYDDELRDFVGEWAKWEIEKFNYSFDGQELA